MNAVNNKIAYKENPSLDNYQQGEKSVYTLSDLPMDKISQAGGKGGALARLIREGYPVPDGFVILPSAFDGDELRSQAWSEAQTLLNDLRIAEKTDSAFAVRSSALAEDSDQASFAGEFESYLNLQSEEDISQAVRNVRRSRHSARVQAYSKAKGINAKHEVAVVVQRMVPAQLSGVLFSADPVKGSHAHMVGEFVQGLGEKLVSGKSNSERFILTRPTGEYQGSETLRPYVSQMYKLAMKLERQLGCPQDIEWAIAGGKLHLLQSRPVTTFMDHNTATGEWNATRSGDFLWSNVNFGEAVSEAMSPLAWSLIQYTLDDWVFIPGYETTGNIGGFPYLNISLFATLVFATGRKRQDLLDTFEGTLYMNLPEDMEIPLVNLSRGDLLKAFLAFLQIGYKQQRGLRQLPDYLSNNISRCRRLEERLQHERSRSGLLDLWIEEIGPHIKSGVWTVLGTATNASDYAIALRRDLSKLVGPEDANLLIANIGGTGELLLSLGPLVGLSKVANGEMDIDFYLQRYGHRGPHEFEVSYPRPVEDPTWLEGQLKEFQVSPIDIDVLLAKQREAFTAAWERFMARNPRKAGPFWKRIQESARRSRQREEARSEYVRDRWLARKFALRVGEMTGLDDDIFYLSLDELLALLDGDESALAYISARKETQQRYKALPPLPSIIRGRFEPFKWATDPQRRSNIYDANAPQDLTSPSAANLLQGSAGSAGRVEGRVRLLFDPSDGNQLQEGEVLVAVQTDIAWTLLFPRAAAVVTDVGAPLSHAAIVARELGVPAVVGCGDATMRLKTGDRVRVDGGQGFVEILQNT